MGRVFNDKIRIIDQHTLEHWNTLHGSGRTVEKSGILLQVEKVPKASNGDLTCYVFSLEDAVAHLSVTDPSSIVTTEKQKTA